MNPSLPHTQNSRTRSTFPASQAPAERGLKFTRRAGEQVAGEWVGRPAAPHELRLWCGSAPTIGGTGSGDRQDRRGAQPVASQRMRWRSWQKNAPSPIEPDRELVRDRRPKMFPLFCVMRHRRPFDLDGSRRDEGRGHDPAVAASSMCEAGRSRSSAGSCTSPGTPSGRSCARVRPPSASAGPSPLGLRRRRDHMRLLPRDRRSGRLVDCGHDFAHGRLVHHVS